VHQTPVIRQPCSRSAPVQLCYHWPFVFRHLSILALVASLTFLAGLGRAAIGDSDEAFYAEAAREMVESGDWITPYYNYEYRFQKPILYYWMAAGTFVLIGVGEAAARFPSAFSGVALALLAYGVGRRWMGPRVGFLAGLITATNFGYYAMARLALPDLPLAAFISLSIWGALEALRAAGDPAGGWDSAIRRWLLLASASAALGFLTKGPVAVALPALVLFVAALADRRWRTAGRHLPFGGRDLGLALGLFAVIAVPWYVAMVSVHGPGYLDRFFLDENVERFATDRYNYPRPVWFYLPIVAGGLLPWSPFMLVWLPGAWRFLRRRVRLDGASLLLILWVLAPLAFYSVSVGKQPRYILPVLPPLAVLLAASVARRLAPAAEAWNGRSPLLSVCATLSAVVLIVLGVLLHRAKPLLFALDPQTGMVATIVIFTSGLVLMLLAWTRPASWLPWTLAASSVATLLSLHFSVYSAAGLEPVQRMAAMHARVAEDAAASGTYRVFVRNLIFYTGRRQTDLTTLDELASFLSRPDRVVSVVPADALEPLQEQYGIEPVVLGSVLYFNPAGVRLRTLLWPEPAEDLETVLLVANR
jgi:4-amino-4-deoxy-L-arabinose transferase-like glycosyltransferase